MNILFLRHATFIVTMGGFRFLVDPMFSEMGTMDPSPNTSPVVKDPIVELPENINLSEITEVDAVILTHTHRDHWDDAAIRLLVKHIPLICQPADVRKIMESGFTNVIAVHDRLTWNGIDIRRTGAKHGVGEIGEKMGLVSGFILSAMNEPSLYITGDTVWCEEVKSACHEHPDVIVAFAGGAAFETGGPITMNEEDVYQLSIESPNSQIVAVHMEAWNHCHVRRDGLREYLLKKGEQDRILIPNNGERLLF